MRYRGREFTDQEIARIKEMMKADAKLNRMRLSRQFCREVNWVDAGGRFKEMACRVAMLQMDRDGLIILPQAQLRSPVKPKQAGSSYSAQGEPGEEISCRAGDLRGLSLDLLYIIQPPHIE